MAQKKKKKPQQQAKKASEPVYAAKMEPKARLLLLLGVAVIMISFVTIFSAARFEYGSEMYKRMQMLAYGGMALAGGLIAWSSKYNQTRHQVNVKMVGVVFVFLGIGYIIGLLING